jgi:hypothetical protein
MLVNILIKRGGISYRWKTDEWSEVINGRHYSCFQKVDTIGTSLSGLIC